MKRRNVLCLLAAVLAVATMPCAAQEDSEMEPHFPGEPGFNGPWGRFRGHNFDRNPFFPDFRFFGYPYGAYPERYFGYPYPYYHGSPYDDSYYDFEPNYRDRYQSNLAVLVQTELARRGYYRGLINGVIGPVSQMAIREFQADEGLPITGRIDERLLRALGTGELSAAPPDTSVTPLPSPAPSAPEQGSPPVAAWVKGKEGQQVLSPFTGGVVDVSGFPPGSEARCPYSGKIFLVPTKP
jgi:Putative peptidoglycan binding domain